MLHTKLFGAILLALLTSIPIALSAAEQSAREPTHTVSQKEDENPFMDPGSAATLKTAQPAPPPTSAEPASASTAPAQPTQPAATPNPTPTRGMGQPTTRSNNRATPAATFEETQGDSSPPTMAAAKPSFTLLQVLQAKPEEFKKSPALLEYARKSSTKVEVFSEPVNWVGKTITKNALAGPNGGEKNEMFKLLQEWQSLEQSLGIFFQTKGIKSAVWEYSPEQRIQINDLMRKRQLLYSKLQKKVEWYVKRHGKKTKPPPMNQVGNPPSAVEQANDLLFLATETLSSSFGSPQDMPYAPAQTPSRR